MSSLSAQSLRRTHANLWSLTLHRPANFFHSEPQGTRDQVFAAPMHRLLILLDYNTSSWGEGGEGEEKLKFKLPQVLDQLVIFLNAFTLLNSENKYTIITYSEYHW